MKNLETYFRKGLIKKQNPNFKQIEKQLKRAEKDLKTFNLVVDTDPEWASAIAYQSMLRAGRALLFAHGFLPIDGQRHKTVVEVTSEILGSKFELTTKQFNRFRKKRNIFFYDSEDAKNYTEATRAAKTAKELLEEIKEKIEKLRPQQEIAFSH